MNEEIEKKFNPEEHYFPKSGRRSVVILVTWCVIISLLCLIVAFQDGPAQPSAQKVKESPPEYLLDSAEL